MNKLISIFASAYAATTSIILVVVVTLAAELSAPFKAWLAGFTGHHWVTKSWVALVAYILVFGYLKLTVKSAAESQTRASIFRLEMATVLGFVIILGFYLYEFFKH